MTEDDQLPQVVDDLHDVHVSPGSPFAKMQLKVKGMFVNRCVMQTECRARCGPPLDLLANTLPSPRLPQTAGVLVQGRPPSEVL